jgi:transcriptional regulator with XRE-family HTH domain
LYQGQAPLSCSAGWGAIEKSVFTKEYEVFLRLLREARKEAGLTQRQVASRFRHHQAFVSRSETGERRLDIIEVRAFCKALGVPFREFVGRLEDELEREAQPEQSHPRDGTGAARQKDALETGTD